MAGGLIVDFIRKSRGKEGEGKILQSEVPFYAHFFTKSPLLKMEMINFGADQTIKI